MTEADLRSAIRRLGIEDRIRLVEDVWDEIASTPEAVPIPDWQKEELARRRDEYLRDPGSCISWDEAKRRLRGEPG